MGNRRWLFGIILTVPLIGFAVGEGIQMYMNAELRSALTKQSPDADPGTISKATIDKLCQNRSPAIGELCDSNDHLNYMQMAAIGAAGAGLLLLLAIRVAGTTARTNRILLLWVFKPGLYLTAVVLIGLVLTHAAIAMAAIYYGESALIGRVHIFIIGAIGLGALAGLFAIAGNAFSIVKKVQTHVIGKIVTRGEAPALWGRVEILANRLGALHPENIVLGLDPNFFVTEANVVCLSGNCVGRTLYCSLPLMRILTTSEFEGVVGHELGHYKGLDTKFSRQFYPIYRGTTNSLIALQQAGAEGGAGVIALLPAIAIFSYFLQSFAVAEANISRIRELAADKEGSSVSDPQTFATALVKIHAFSPYWDGLRNVAGEALRHGQAFINASKTYAETVEKNATNCKFSDLTSTHTNHPTDSHPPLGVRLESIGKSIDQVQNDALSVKPTEPALNVIPAAEKMEEELSGMYQIILARQLGIDLDQVATNRD